VSSNSAIKRLADIAGIVDRAVDAIRILALDGIAVLQQPIDS
jgi:hypothetical protein